MKKAVVILLMGICLTTGYASEDNEKIYLHQMLNQLNAMKPLIIAASKEQPKKSRVKFHYHAYRDATGIKQNGLMDDIHQIKKGIQERIRYLEMNDRHIHTIEGDYLPIKNIKVQHGH